MHAGRAQVMQPLQVAALALPVANRKINKVQLRNAAKVRDRKYRHKHRLQTSVVAFVGQLVHLQKSLIRAALHFNQVRYLRCGGYL